MARFDRCEICDYSEQNGSGYHGTNPHSQGRVRQYGDQMLCRECHEIILETVYEGILEEEKDEGIIS